MTILSRLIYSLEVKINIFLLAFEFKRCIEDQELQVDTLLDTSSPKMKTRNRTAIGHLIDTLKFMRQLSISIRGHRDSGRLEPVSEITDIDTSTGNFRAILQLHSLGNSELAAHLKKFSSNAIYLSPGIQNKLITLIGDKIFSSISFEVKSASCFAVIADETTDKSIKSQLSIVISSDGFYKERAERSLQAPLKNVAKQPPSKKCREASTTKKCHKAAHPKKCRKEGSLKIRSKCSPPQKCCEAALQKVPCYV